MPLDRPLSPALEFTPLPSLGALVFRGRDAEAFLQGQLSNDARAIATDTLQLAAYSTPQGRVVALLRLYREDDQLVALLPRELATEVAARLSRFILRSKVQIENLSDQLSVIALFGPAVTPVPDLPRIPVVAAGAQRRLLMAPVATAEHVLAACNAIATRTTPEAYLAALVAAGEPEVFAATSEHWVAQMLNLDLLQGISFTKGCYTGQEIIARTQHLGRIKRRLQRYGTTSAVGIEPGETVLRDGDKVGEIVLAAPRPAAGAQAIECLAVVNLEARDLPLRLASGATLTPLPLPYSVP